MNTKPIVACDVDGVINFLGPWDIDLTYRELNGYPIRWPSFMPGLVRHLTDVADVYWLTTWRENANRFILPALGIEGELPVITDGTDRRVVDWKVPALIERMPDFGSREVYWIEDFYGGYHHHYVPGVELVDTWVTDDNPRRWGDFNRLAGLFPITLPEALQPDSSVDLWSSSVS